MWSSESEKGPPGTVSHRLRDFEQHLSDLKKENFSLKLRIYFLEERVQNQSPDQDQDLSRTNIELKVQLQSLKKELEEKQQQLSAAEPLSNQNAEQQQQRDEATNQIRESLEKQIQQLQQELCESQRLQQQALDQKDRLILELSTQTLTLEQKVQELSTRPHPEQEREVCDSTTERCLTELQRAQNQVQTLQTKIRISEDRNKLLQKRLGEMELELRDVREEAQDQERNLLDLQDSLFSRDQEVADLHRVLEEQNKALHSLKEAALRQFSSSPACGVSELQMMLQQKNIVDRELHELKTQLHKTGFSSLSQIRKALLELKSQNQDLKRQLSQQQEVTSQRREVTSQRREVTPQRQEVASQQQEQMMETREESDQWEGWDSQLTFDPAQAEAEAQSQDSPLRRGGAVDLGYETCERSETEAERDTSSPEFDDLEMCLSLDHGSQWWTLQDQDQDRDQDQNSAQTQTLTPDGAPHRQVLELQKLVQRLKTELNRSQTQVHRLQASVQSQSEVKSQSESELDPDFMDLLSRVESLENQFKTESRTETEEDSKSGYLGLVHLQARELSGLRQVLRESRGLVQILVQVQTDQLKGLEDLLVSRDPDYGLGVRVRDLLREGHELLLRLSRKISLKDLPEDPDDKTELLAMRLSKELQQKDLLIESLRSKLRSDTPTESTDQSDRISYVSDGQLSNQDEDLGSESNSELQLDQSERSSHYDGQSERSGRYDGQSERSGRYDSQSEQSSRYYGQSEQSGRYNSQSERSGQTRCQLERSGHFNSQAERSGHYDGRSERIGQSGQSSHYDIQSEHIHSHTDPRLTFSSVPPSVTSLHSLPGYAHSAALLSTLKPSLGAPPAPPAPPPRALGSGPGFSLAEVHQELQMLQKQLQTPHSGASLRPRPIVALSAPGFSSSSLDSGLRPGLGLSLWDMPMSQPIAASLSSGHALSAESDAPPGSELVGEVRSLRLRLEESIQTNERLRTQLETRLDPPTAAAPTNIYIQGPDSTETRVLRETSFSLQQRLRESLLEAERLREALLLVQMRLKEAELQAQRWAEQSRSSQSEASTQRQEVTSLRQEQQCSLEVIQRLQLEVQALQQQLRNQSEQSEGSGSQWESSMANVAEGERARTRKSMSFSDSSPDSDLDEDLDLEPVEDSGPGLNQGWLRLQRTLQDSVDLLQILDRTLKTRTKPGPDQDCERLRVLLHEAQTLSLKTRTIDPQVQRLRSEVKCLRQKVSEQEQSLRETTEKLQQNLQRNLQPSSSCSPAMEQLIINQLTRTRNVLRKAKTNLQATRSDLTVS